MTTINPSNARPFAVVTGAAHAPGKDSIGFELCKQFAQNGYDLIMVAETAAIEDSAAEISNAYGVNIYPMQLDLRVKENVEKLYEAIFQTGRDVDAIAINAGVGVSGYFIETNLEEELAMIDLNVKSTTILAKLVLKDMVQKGKGRILFTASMAATTPAPFLSVYAATKAYVLSLSDALRNEVKHSGVTVTALMPGPTDTNFFERADMMDTAAGVGDKDDPAEVARQAYEALMDGRAHIAAESVKSKLMAWMNEIMPEGLKAEMQRKMLEPGSAANATKH